jgi:hypothetical protein
MKNVVLLLLLTNCWAQTTPNLGLNVPNFGTANWNILLNSNFISLDSYLSGGTPLPNLSIAGGLTLSGAGSGSYAKADGTGFGTPTGTLPSTIAYIGPGTSQSAIQTILTAAVGGEEIWFSGTSTACGLTLSANNVRLRGLSREGAVLQCATANSPVLTVSGQADEIYGINFKHITNTPTCPGGNGTATCGDGLQMAGGSYRSRVENVHANFNYNGIVLGYTSYSELSNSISEFNQNHGVAFVMNASNHVMQWQVSRVLSEQNLGNGFDMTCPSSFSSVQTPGPYITGWTAAYGNVGYGFNFSCSAATTSGIADVWFAGAFASANNQSGFRIDLGPNGGRNAILSAIYSEQSGTYTGTAGFSQAAQTATNVGYGLEITSSCDNSPAPIVTGGILWSNSYSGAISSCPGTSFNNLETDNNGSAAASAQTEAGITINASNIAVTAGYHRKSSNENYGTYLLSGDTPSVIGIICDSAIGAANCVFTATAPTNGYQQQVGQTRLLTGNGVPTMNCSAGWQYTNIGASSASTLLYVCPSEYLDSGDGSLVWEAMDKAATGKAAMAELAARSVLEAR